MAFIVHSFIMLVLLGIVAMSSHILNIKSIKAFVDVISVAVIGALVGAVIIIATRSISDLATALIAIVTGLFYFTNVSHLISGFNSQSIEKIV